MLLLALYRIAALGLGSALALSPGLAALSPQIVRVRLYDPVIEAPRRARAQVAAAAALHDAGITLAWRDCSEPAVAIPECGEPPGPDELIVRFTLSPPLPDDGTLGRSMVDSETRRGYLATIFVDRVLALAARAGVEGGGLVGLTMAHEIVHLLRGDTKHSPTGLLRANWTVEEVTADVPGDWRLTASDGLDLRRILAARLQSGAPAVVTAERRGQERPALRRRRPLD